MTNFKDLPSTPAALPRRRARARLGSSLGLVHRVGLGLVTLAVALVIAGCGSGGSSTITVGNENPADEQLASATTTTSTSAASTAPAKTPTSGPLSKEPAVPAKSGPAPTTLVTK